MLCCDKLYNKSKKVQLVRDIKHFLFVNGTLEKYKFDFERVRTCYGNMNCGNCFFY